MHPINNAVKTLVSMLDDCGIEDSPVTLMPDYDLPRCTYEHGVPVKVHFGDRSAVFVSEEPVKATTKASFMRDAPLKKSAQRAAAAGIINAVSGFLCTIRRLHACTKEEHTPCREELKKILSGKRIYCCGNMPDARKIAGSVVEDPKAADLILITGDGLVSDAGEILSEYPPEKLLYLGPSTTGTASMLRSPHFCPFGRANLQTPEE
ncbi:MAG: hypothetical protein LUQ07_06065 [Methanospirillum sp.]|nr:hypothetical protein [Methanospirillum sp.]